MKVRIQNDGQPAYMTKITDAETGKELDWRIFRVELDARSGNVPTATIHVYMPAVDVIAEAEIKEVCPCCGREQEPQRTLVDECGIANIFNIAPQLIGDTDEQAKEREYDDW